MLYFSSVFANVNFSCIPNRFAFCPQLFCKLRRVFFFGVQNMKKDHRKDNRGAQMSPVAGDGTISPYSILHWSMIHGYGSIEGQRLGVASKNCEQSNGWARLW